MLFRVHGVDHKGTETSVVIECDSEATARNQAISAGLINTTRVEEAGGEPPTTWPPRLKRSPQTPIERIAASKLIKNPISTIASGVFLGLLAWGIFSIVVYGLLALVFTALS